MKTQFLALASLQSYEHLYPFYRLTGAKYAQELEAMASVTRSDLRNASPGPIGAHRPHTTEPMGKVLRDH